MKTKSIITIIAALTIISCSKTKTTDFLYLNSDQLKPLGIELNDNGLFYKNMNPKWKSDGEKYCLLAFQSTRDNYLTTSHFTESDIVNAKENKDTTLTEKFYTKNDFYPLLIGNKKGNMSLDNYTYLKKELKLLPIAICMKDAKNLNRNDTIIVWFKPTELIKNALPTNINLENYLNVPTILKNN